MEVVKRERPVCAPKRARAGLKCKAVIGAMGDFFSEALPSKRRFRFEEHLRGCPECERFLRTYERTVEAMRDVLSSRAPTPVLRLRKPARGLHDVEVTDELLN